MVLLNYQGIYVMWLRQMKRFVRTKSRIIANFIQPFLFLSVLGMGLAGTAFPGLPSGINYIDLLTPGIICMSILFPSVFTGLSVLWDRQFGFLQEVLVAPVSRLSIVIGRTLGGSTISLIQGMIVFLIAIALGVNFKFSPLFLLSFVFMILISFIAIGMGLIIASKMKSIEGFQFIMSLLIMPLLFLSAPFSTLGSMPSFLRVIAFLNPLTYGVDGLRATMIGYSYFPIYLNLSVLIVLSVLMMGIGSYLFSKSEA